MTRFARLGDNRPTVMVFVRNACALFALLACASACNASHSIEPPSAPEVRAVHGEASVELDVVENGKAGAPAFAYDGAVGVAPTIRVHPGDRIRVVLRNRLPHDDDMPNDVNLHVHGLAVSPKPPSDDVMMTLAHPGQRVEYRIPIPRTQQPGLYWYHPHAHGQTYWQITSGMSGAIVVEGIQDRIPALRTMRERILVLREVQSEPDVHTIPLAARPERMRAAVMAARRRAGRTSVVDDDDAQGQPCAPKSGLQVTVNGSQRPAIGIDPGEKQFFRVVNASASRYFDLAVDGAPLDLVALDGVPLDAYAGSPAMQRVRHIVVAPAGRAEFVVRGGAHASVLRSLCFNAGSAGDRNPAVDLADLQPDGGGQRRAANAHLDADTNVRAPQPLPAPVAHRTIRFTEDANGFYLNGKTFDMDGPPAIVARSGTIEEWTLVNASDEVHDFHIHQVHFAVVDVDGHPVDHPHWVDTATVAPQTFGPKGSPTPGRLRVLVDFRDPAIRGTFVYHCHILDHEDGGMMAKIEVR